MVTYNNIVDYFKLFANNHFFIQSFSHGNIEEADLAKYNNYPIMHVNYTGSTYDEVQNYSFEVYVLGLPPDKLDKISFQTEVISDSKQCLEDLISDIKIGENIFTLNDGFDLVSANMTPLEEETKNVLSGMVLDLTFQVPFTYDTCDAPLIGVTPTPSGDCLPVRVVNSTLSYDVEVAAGGTLTLSDNTITDVDGTTRDVAAQTDVVCEWTSFNVVNTDGDVCLTIGSYPATSPILPKITVTEVNGTTESVATCVDIVCEWTTLFVINSSETILATVLSYPSGNRIPISDITLTEVNGDDVTRDAGIDLTCSWFDIVLKDSEGTTLDTIESYPSGGEFVVPVSSATPYPFIIQHRKPSYTTGNTGDYPTLFAADYFDLYFPTGAIEMVRCGADPYTLAANNRFGNTSRYTATDGTPSDTGTARFSSYGSGVANIVRDNLCGVMWYNLPLGTSVTWDNAQSEIDALNSASFGGFTDWIRPTRDIFSISAVPDNNEDVHTSPNLVEDTGTRRYMTCDALPNQSSGYIIFFGGSESYQSTSTTAGGQNRVIACRLMTLTELFG
jgi:hypothetical protein